MIVTSTEIMTTPPAIAPAPSTGGGTGFQDMLESAIAEPHCAGCGAKGVKLYQYDKCWKCLEPDLRDSQQLIDTYRP